MRRNDHQTSNKKNDRIMNEGWVKVERMGFLRVVIWYKGHQVHPGGGFKQAGTRRSFPLPDRESGTTIHRSETSLLIPALPRYLVRMPERLGNPECYGCFQCHVNSLDKIHVVPRRNKNRPCALYGSDCHPDDFGIVQHRFSRSAC